MDWFQNKTTQLIALVSIVGTLAGFGYTGAGYVTRLEAVEKRSGVSYKKELQALTDTDVAIEKEILVLQTQIKALQDKVDTIQKKQDDSRNPLISIN